MARYSGVWIIEICALYVIKRVLRANIPLSVVVHYFRSFMRITLFASIKNPSKHYDQSSAGCHRIDTRIFPRVVGDTVISTRVVKLGMRFHKPFSSIINHLASEISRLVNFQREMIALEELPNGEVLSWEFHLKNTPL